MPVTFQCHHPSALERKRGGQARRPGSLNSALVGDGILASRSTEVAITSEAMNDSTEPAVWPVSVAISVETGAKRLCLGGAVVGT